MVAKRTSHLTWTAVNTRPDLIDNSRAKSMMVGDWIRILSIGSYSNDLLFQGGSAF